MAAGKLDIEFYRGDDYSHVLDFVLESGSPVNISARTYAAHIRKVRSQPTTDAEFLCVITDGPNGVLTITIPKSQTDTLLPGEYYWDLQEDIGSTRTTIIAGTARVLQDVTR